MSKSLKTPIKAVAPFVTASELLGWSHFFQQALFVVKLRCVDDGIRLVIPAVFHFQHTYRYIFCPIVLL